MSLLSEYRDEGFVVCTSDKASVEVACLVSWWYENFIALLIIWQFYDKLSLSHNTVFYSSIIFAYVIYGVNTFESHDVQQV